MLIVILLTVMNNFYDVIVVGAGQAGLSTSYYLKKNNINHLVIDSGKIADTWQKKRWDSFCLVTQNRQCQLPGYSYNGDDPEGFMGRDDIVKYIKEYAAFVDPPLIQETRVDRISVDESENLFSLITANGIIKSEIVIIATGTHQKKKIPDIAEQLRSEIVSLHSSDYKNPDSLPPGDVLIVGSGQSGCQIAEDIFSSGRKVHLSVSKAPRIPRKYRGKDILEWADLIGMYKMEVGNHPEGESIRFKTHPHVSGARGGHTINLRELGQNGIRLLGRVKEIDDKTIRLKNDLQENLTNADTADAKIKKTIDEYIEKNSIKAPLANPDINKWVPEKTPETIDVINEGIRSVIWATGYKYDFTWIDLPVFDERGYPVYQRGITDVPGLYFVGLHWMHTWGSGLFYGVGKDAEFISQKIVNKLKNVGISRTG